MLRFDEPLPTVYLPMFFECDQMEILLFLWWSLPVNATGKNVLKIIGTLNVIVVQIDFHYFR